MVALLFKLSTLLISPNLIHAASSIRGGSGSVDNADASPLKGQQTRNLNVCEGLKNSQCPDPPICQWYKGDCIEYVTSVVSTPAPTSPPTNVSFVQMI